MVSIQASQDPVLASILGRLTSLEQAQTVTHDEQATQNSLILQPGGTIGSLFPGGVTISAAGLVGFTFPGGVSFVQTATVSLAGATGNVKGVGCVWQVTPSGTLNLTVEANANGSGNIAFTVADPTGVNRPIGQTGSVAYVIWQ